MLVLSRGSGESIVIGEDVRLTVLEVRGGQVRLGIAAPRSVSIHRSEVEGQDWQPPTVPAGDDTTSSGPPSPE